MTTKRCVGSPTDDVQHCWKATGLDVIDGVLCNTRRCLWCDVEHHKPYGSKRRAWQATKESERDG